LVTVGFMRRFDPPYVALREQVRGGELGAPVIAHCVSRTVHTYPGGDSASSITQSAIHELDIVPWLLDSPIVEVSWQHGRSSVNSAGRQDPQFYLMRTASDVLVTVELFLNARYGCDTRCEVGHGSRHLRAGFADAHRHRRRTAKGRRVSRRLDPALLTTPPTLWSERTSKTPWTIDSERPA
jgi:predicted dehydrogenase